MPGANPEGKDQRRPAVFAADEIYTKNQEEMQCQYIYIWPFMSQCGRRSFGLRIVSANPPLSHWRPYVGISL